MERADAMICGFGNADDNEAIVSALIDDVCELREVVKHAGFDRSECRNTYSCCGGCRPLYECEAAYEASNVRLKSLGVEVGEM